MTSTTSVAIIGAGMTGLACAQRLAQAGVRSVLFDKGRGIGGRVATRQTNGLQFDHGAQYVTAKGAGFAAVLEDLTASGAAALWPDGSGRARIVGTPGMAALCATLAAGQDVRQGVRVTAVRSSDGGWQLRMRDVWHSAARIVVTVPAPQVAGLVGADHPLVAQLTGVRLDPCLTLMAGIASPPLFVTRQTPDGPIAWIAQDSAKPSRPATDVVAWVAQAGPTYSAIHLEDDLTAIATRMLPMLCDQLGISADRATHAAAHRWRYAHVAAPLGRPFLRDASGSLYLGGDWCIGPRVEAAWTSGTAIATDLLERMS